MGVTGEKTGFFFISKVRCASLLIRWKLVSVVGCLSPLERNLGDGESRSIVTLDVRVRRGGTYTRARLGLDRRF